MLRHQKDISSFDYVRYYDHFPLDCVVFKNRVSRAFADFAVVFNSLLIYTDPYLSRISIK